MVNFFPQSRLPPTTLSTKWVNTVVRILKVPSGSYVSSLPLLLPHPCPSYLTMEMSPLMWTMLNKETKKKNLNLNLNLALTRYFIKGDFFFQIFSHVTLLFPIRCFVITNPEQPLDTPTVITQHIQYFRFFFFTLSHQITHSPLLHPSLPHTQKHTLTDCAKRSCPLDHP